MHNETTKKSDSYGKFPDGGSVFLKWGLYLQSLALVFVLLAIETVYLPNAWSASGECAWTCIKENVFALICVIGLTVATVSFLYFKYWCRGSDYPQENDPIVKEVREANADIVGFLMTTIVPLAALTMSPERRGLILMIVLYAIGRMSVDSCLLATNPTLLLLGYKIYRVRLGNSADRILVTKDWIKENDEIDLRMINNAVIFGRRV